MKDDIAINTINSYSISEKIGVIKFSSESSTNRPPPPLPGPELLGRRGCGWGGGGGVTPHKGKSRKRAQLLQRGPGMLKLRNVLNVKEYSEKWRSKNYTQRSVSKAIIKQTIHQYLKETDLH
jgi:hypothetical protein